MFGRKKRPDSDFSEELRAHLELEADRLRAEGLSTGEASHAAQRNLGNMRSVEERFHESTRWMWFEHLLEDTRYALRRLRNAPAFTLTAGLTLALGIGATTAIFTLAHAVLLKSLPVANPSQLYRLGKRTHCCVWGGYAQSDGPNDVEFSIVSYELYKYFRDHTKGFEEMAAFQANGSYLGVRRAHSANAAQTHFAKFVSGNYFQMFGIQAYAGRLLTPGDDIPGAPPAAVMSYLVWQKMGLDRTIVGSVFNLNGKPFTIVGITPPGFFGDTLRTLPPELFLPLNLEPAVIGEGTILKTPEAHWLDIIGRAAPGADAAALESQMRVELQQWLRSHWGDMDPNERSVLPKQTLYLSPGGAGITSMREQYEEWLKILLGVAGFVLLIVCANVANLMLVRGMERRQQTSLSMALGARPARLIRQALTESVVLSLFGGAAGLALAFAGTRLILHFAFDARSAVPISASPSMPVLLFAFGASLITGVGFGIIPAWVGTRVDPVEALRGANRATRSSGSIARRSLVVLQAALSLVLLSASGLLTQTLRQFEHQDFGFSVDDRTVVNIDPVLAGYTPERLEPLYRRLHDSLAAIPGVVSVAYTGYTPLSGDSWNEGIYVEGKPAPGPNDDSGAAWARISAGYFEALESRVMKGRPIVEQDTATSRHVAVVNEAFATKFFKGENPIGRHFGKDSMKYAGDYEIVGVVRDSRYLSYNLSGPVRPMYFVPATQFTVYERPNDTSGELRSLYLHDFLIRMQPGVPFSETLVRRAMSQVDPNLPVINIQSLKEQVETNFGQQRLIAQLTSLFAVLALVLASIGLYGVTTHAVGVRTNEIGLRMALGADRGSVMSLILKGAFALIAFGLIVGVPLALASGKILHSQLYGINPYDPAILSAAVAALGIAALIAALIPAWRASSMAPMQALRAE